MLFGYFTLLVALIIEAVGAYYSVTGLAAIFSGAIIPIIIMGGALEVGKVTAAVWLKMNWERASMAYKTYLVPAVAFLMILTSMGIFGFLSKAHSDQSLVSGDSMAKVAIYDEKIKTSKDNIEANRKALKQMDEAVDQVMGRSTDEKGADKAVALRRGQAKERARLQNEITQEQKTIGQLNEEAAPLRAEFRKVEADVGPIKYIAALVYGDNPDANVLEKAVRLVIIIIVAVFDPLALVLILAAQQSLRWGREEKVEAKSEDEDKEPGPVVAEAPVEELPPPTEPTPADLTEEAESEEHPLTEEEREQQELQEVERFFWRGKMIAKALDAEEAERTADEANALIADIEPEEPEVEIPEPEPEVVPAELLETTATVIEDLTADIRAKEEQLAQVTAELDFLKNHTSGVEGARNEEQAKAIALETQLTELQEAYRQLEEQNARLQSQQVSQDIILDLKATDDTTASGRANFGTEFPSVANKGDMFLRVDYLPSRLYKFNGVKWIESDKTLTDQFAYAESYIKHLVDRIQTGEYDPDELNEVEREKIKEYLDKKDGIQ